MRPAPLVLALLVLAGCNPALLMHDRHVIDLPASAAQSAAPGPVTYHCDGNQSLTLTYGQQADGTASVLLAMPDGNFTLLQEPDSTRYSWPSDGSNYVWQLAGGTGTLLWHDGETASERPRLTQCQL